MWFKWYLFSITIYRGNLSVVIERKVFWNPITTTPLTSMVLFDSLKDLCHVPERFDHLPCCLRLSWLLTSIHANARTCSSIPTKDIVKKQCSLSLRISNLTFPCTPLIQAVFNRKKAVFNCKRAGGTFQQCNKILVACRMRRWSSWHFGFAYMSFGSENFAATKLPNTWPTC